MLQHAEPRGKKEQSGVIGLMQVVSLSNFQVSFLILSFGSNFRTSY